MKQYKKIYELKNTAKDKLEGKYGGAVLILLLSALMSGILRLSISSVAGATMSTVYSMTGSLNTVTALSFVFDALLLLATILLGVMNAGIALYFLNMACGQPFSIGNLFYGYQGESKKTLLITAAMVLLQAVCLWPGQYLAQNYLNTGDVKWIGYAFLACGLGLCLYLPVSLGISMSFYLMLDFPQNPGGKTLSLCWRMMKGHKRRLFRLELSFLPLMLLCVLSFGIGFLWLNPYMQMTYTCFFLDLMNPRDTETP
jgi:hypothetical protein